MTSISNNVVPQYLGSGDPALKDYFPVWVNNMAADATVEGSMLNGAVQGADEVRSVVLTIRSFYENQEFKFAGPYGDGGFVEHYIARVNGEPPLPNTSPTLSPRVEASRLIWQSSRCDSSEENCHAPDPVPFG